MADNTNTQERPVVTRAAAKAVGSSRYFTGKTCPAGHRAERQVTNGTCVICGAARTAAIRAAHAVGAPVGATQYMPEKPCKRGHIGPRQVKGGTCVACDTARWAVKRAADPKGVAASMARYYSLNSKKICARTRAWAAANPEQRRATQLARHAAHPEIRKANKAKRRAREHQAEGTHTAKDIAALLMLQRSKCAHSWCRKELAGGYHADHVIPLALGGSNGKRNLQLLCQPCNQSKRAVHPIDFAQRHGLLL